jgi:hypothetical protein
MILLKKDARRSYGSDSMLLNATDAKEWCQIYRGHYLNPKRRCGAVVLGASPSAYRAELRRIISHTETRVRWPHQIRLLDDDAEGVLNCLRELKLELARQLT